MTAMLKVVESTPISDTHKFLDYELERQTDAKFINRVVNHPDVMPWVQGTNLGELDCTALVQNKWNVLLAGKFGAVLFIRHQPGYYEAHTQVLPEGRGKWTIRLVRAALHWMFTRTDAVEIVTRVPQGNLAALALTRMIHGVYEFTNPRGWVFKNELVPADIYALRIQDWMKRAPGLVERGHWFHDRLVDEFKKQGHVEPQHDDDETHDRYVGAAAEMFLAGQYVKGAVFYNRWAVMSGYAPIGIVTEQPLVLDIGNALLMIRNNDFWVLTCR